MERKSKLKQIELVNEGASELGDTQNLNLNEDQDAEAFMIDEGTFHAADSYRPLIKEKPSKTFKKNPTPVHDGPAYTQE